MPESRLANTRATLPTGYQYGDAGDGAKVILVTEVDVAVPVDALFPPQTRLTKPYESARCNTLQPTPFWLIEEFIRVTANR